MILPNHLLWGIHEMQSLEVCVDFGPICGRDPRKSAPTLILDLSERMRMLVDRFPSLSGLSRLSYGAARNQRCHADLVSIMENLCADLKLGLQPAIFRLGGVSSTSSSLLIYHFLISLGPSQPLLIYRH